MYMYPLYTIYLLVHFYIMLKKQLGHNHIRTKLYSVSETCHLNVNELPLFFNSSMPKHKLGAVVIDIANHMIIKTPHGLEPDQQPSLFLKFQYTKKALTQ